MIQDFATKVRPLNDLTRKDTSWTWGEIEQQAFNQLKHDITADPVLVFPESGQPYLVETDASGFATGGILLQKQNDVWRVVTYRSQSMTPPEKNYQIYNKELLAVVQALKEWRHHLLGAKHAVEV